jgi:hypothetical protein
LPPPRSVERACTKLGWCDLVDRFLWRNGLLVQASLEEILTLVLAVESGQWAWMKSVSGIASTPFLKMPPEIFCLAGVAAFYQRSSSVNESFARAWLFQQLKP